MDFTFLFIDWLGKPVWMWLGFISIVIALLVFDLGVLHRDSHEIEVRESLGFRLIHSQNATRVARAIAERKFLASLS